MTAPGSYHVAQLNVGQLRYPVEDPRSAGFTDNTAAINALAERSAGFVWRLVEDAQASFADGVTLYPHDPNALRTLSVWDSPQALAHFVLNTLHGKFVNRKAEWFVPQDHRTYVIWPIPAGHIPTPGEGLQRLAKLETMGPTEAAYDFGYLREMPA